jgi:hypothetical protein
MDTRKTGLPPDVARALEGADRVWQLWAMQGVSVPEAARLASVSQELAALGALLARVGLGPAAAADRTPHDPRRTAPL